jgi:hypothetical protein
MRKGFTPEKITLAEIVVIVITSLVVLISLALN